MSTNRPMRKANREIKDAAIIEEVIREMDVIRIGFFDGEEVYIVPLSFGFEAKDGKFTFYMHGAKEGRKADLVRTCAKAGFELDRLIQIKTNDEACNHSAKFRSIIGHGAISEVTDTEEKKKALTAVMAHNTGKADWVLPDKMVEATFVFRIEPDWLTCKEHE